MENPIFQWMIWGETQFFFWKHPYTLDIQGHLRGKLL